MPSKLFLMENYVSAGAILQYANEQLGVDSTMSFVKEEHTGQNRVRCKLISNPTHIFEGIGATKKEAMADCISSEFPG